MVDSKKGGLGIPIRTIQEALLSYQMARAFLQTKTNFLLSRNVSNWSPAVTSSRSGWSIAWLSSEGSRGLNPGVVHVMSLSRVTQAQNNLMNRALLLLTAPEKGLTMWRAVANYASGYLKLEDRPTREP
jgi:hypothetical protein